MKSSRPSTPRRTVQVELRLDLIEAAERLGIDIPTACEAGLAERVAKTWLEENREAIEGWNAYKAEHGLPFAKYRQF